MVRSSAGFVGALALVVSACAAAPPESATPNASTGQSHTAPTGEFASPTPLPRASVFVEGWASLHGVAMSARYIAWFGVPSGDPRAVPEQIVLRDRSTGRTSVIATAPSPAGEVGWLRISDDWLVWADYTDRIGATDWRVHAARLPAGQATTLFQATSETRTIDRPEFELRQSELVVTTRQLGTTSKALLVFDLDRSTSRVLLQPRAGELLGWPSLDGSAAFVESLLDNRSEGP